jgi:hypothetical protein
VVFDPAKLGDFATGKQHKPIIQDPQGTKVQKFKANDQMVNAFGLKKGMGLTGSKIVKVPEVLVSQQKHVTGTMPAPSSARSDVPILIAKAEPAPAPAAAEPWGSGKDPAEDRERIAYDWPTCASLPNGLTRSEVPPRKYQRLECSSPLCCKKEEP